MKPTAAEAIAADRPTATVRVDFTMASPLIPEIKRLIVEVVEGELASEDIADDASLTDLGVHSLRLITLLLRLESAFDVVFPEDVISLTNFGTVQDIRDTLSRLQQRGTGA